METTRAILDAARAGVAIRIFMTPVEEPGEPENKVWVEAKCEFSDSPLAVMAQFDPESAPILAGLIRELAADALRGSPRPENPASESTA
jgi:hypothetical protein